MRTALVFLVLFLATACGGDKNQPAGNDPQQQQSPPPPSSGGEEMSSGQPGPVAAPPDGGAYQFESCVKECVRRNQAQAIPIEQIEANCQGECASDKK